MNIKSIINNRFDCNTRSEHPAVQELIDRFNRNEELDCELLDRGDRALAGAVYMDATYNPEWHPTPHILDLIHDLNARMDSWSKRTVQ